MMNFGFDCSYKCYDKNNHLLLLLQAPFTLMITFWKKKVYVKKCLY